MTITDGAKDKRGSARIVHAHSDDQIDAARQLFLEYEDWLGLDLCFQGFEAELKELPGKYAPPAGILLLADVGDHVAGCVAMRKLSSEICEMKRLFIREKFRGMGIGNSLIEKVVNEAAGRGYKKMRLDTLPGKMGKAVQLYESHGFYEIPPYYENPYGDVLFLEKILA